MSKRDRSFMGKKNRVFGKGKLSFKRNRRFVKKNGIKRYGRMIKFFCRA